MKHSNTRFFTIGLILISISLTSRGQSRQDKTEEIIKKLNLAENQKTNYKFQLEPLKYQATGNDSIKILEIEHQLTNDQIIKRISLAFDDVFNDKEINDIYQFTQSSGFEKFFNSGETYKIIDAKFEDINKEIESITKSIGAPVEKPTTKFEPIPVEMENGFYATVDYNHSIADKDIKLEDKPSLTTKDILEVKKAFNSYNDGSEVRIVFTKEGARKFYLLTKENIGKPIAIVIAKKIVSLPIVNAAIIGGKASISGNFSVEEIDKMIETLKGE